MLDMSIRGTKYHIFAMGAFGRVYLVVWPPTTLTES